MLLSREQLESLDKNELIDYAMKVGELSSLFNNIEERLLKLEGEKAITSQCNTLLVSKIESLESKVTKLEKTVTRNSQYARNRQIELHRVPTSITDLKKTVCSTLSHTGTSVKAGDLDKCHRMKNESSIIIEFKSREKRDDVLKNFKNLKNKKPNLEDLNMANVHITESLCSDYQYLSLLCRKLKAKGKITETWFFNGRLFIKFDTQSKVRIQISHISDLSKHFSAADIASVEYLSSKRDED